ncbi:SIS domain-containing protein [Rhodococcus spongiicola]|uniref:SIS domain-containing protein n=1 Tax=Rhodococcus spongiicola TaxID=2487352 RepID=UPI001F210AFE|nr:SIS domain-containing protein [Rhodococcus spongiicola]
MAADAVQLREAVDGFVGPLLARADLRVIITGAGTSAFVGQIAAPTLARVLNRRVYAVATTDIVSNPREYFAEDVPTLLVSIARSGRSPESVAATRLADERLSEVRHLILTCDPTGDLYLDHQTREQSMVVLMPDRANDEGFAMTSSFSSMLLSCLLILGHDDRSLVEALGGAAEDILTTWQGRIAALTERGYERVVYLGSGPLAGLARESALKLLELTAGRIVTYHDSALGFRHGPKAVVDDHTLVVVYISSDPYTRQYDLDIVAELRADRGADNVIAVAAEPIPPVLGDAWVLGGVAGVGDSFLAAAYVVVAQLLGLSFALHIGTTPDNPFPAGDVNRVVKGVTIHPLAVANASAKAIR